jgi:predicted methyltransferase
MRIGKLFLLLQILVLGTAHGGDEAWRNKLEQALVSPLRSDAERARDANRRPEETLAFMQFRDDMRVLELFPGTGWYTRLLGPVLARRGKLYLALSTDRVRDLVASAPELSAVEILDANPSMPSTGVRGVFDMEEFSFWVEDLDMVVTFRNAHNLTPAGRANLNVAVWEALRPGGLYGVVDHTRRHMEPSGKQNKRRVDPVRVIHEITSAGFEFVAWSDLHYRPGDDLSLEVGDGRVRGQTDRFTLLFRKPAE